MQGSTNVALPHAPPCLCVAPHLDASSFCHELTRPAVVIPLRNMKSLMCAMLLQGFSPTDLILTVYGGFNPTVSHFGTETAASNQPCGFSSDDRRLMRPPHCHPCMLKPHQRAPRRSHIYLLPQTHTADSISARLSVHV